jgi:hypothetical protein
MDALESKYVSTFSPAMYRQELFVDEIYQEFDNLDDTPNPVFEERSIDSYGLETLFEHIHKKNGLVIDTNDSVGINAFVNMKGLLEECVIQDVSVKFNRRISNIAMSFISLEYAQTWLKDIVERYKAASGFDIRVVNCLRN